MKNAFQNTAVGPGSLLVFTHEWDPYFIASVVLVLAHDQRGTLGIIINKTSSEFKYDDLVKDCEGIDVLKAQDAGQRTFLLGGPVVDEKRRLLIVHENQANGDSPASFSYIDNTAPGSMMRAKELAGTGSAFVRVAVDYTGWSPGHLDDEIKGGSWRVLPYNADLVFRTVLQDIFLQAAKQADLHADLISYLINPEPLRKEKGGYKQAIDYLETVRPSAP